MKYDRTYNFSAGPAMMPEPVLEEIAAELLNYRGSGMCVMEMSHRDKAFQDIRDQAEADLRALMGIPDNYKVLFVQGGGTLQFAMVAVNLLKQGVACYVETGAWSKKAIAEAKKVVADALFDEVDFSDADALVLPGGSLGTENLSACEPLRALLAAANAEGKIIG